MGPIFLGITWCTTRTSNHYLTPTVRTNRTAITLEIWVITKMNTHKKPEWKHFITWVLNSNQHFSKHCQWIWLHRSNSVGSCVLGLVKLSAWCTQDSTEQLESNPFSLKHLDFSPPIYLFKCLCLQVKATKAIKEKKKMHLKSKCAMK